MPDLRMLDKGAAVEALACGLETMAFISILPAEQPHAAPDAPIWLEIGFDGPAGGRLEMFTSRSLGTAIAAAVTGDPEPSISAEDALKELMNVVCGALLRQGTLLEGFTISLPLVRSGSADDHWAAFVSAPATAVVDAEGSLVAIRLILAEQV